MPWDIQEMAERQCQREGSRNVNGDRFQWLLVYQGSSGSREQYCDVEGTRVGPEVLRDVGVVMGEFRVSWQRCRDRIMM